MKAYQYGKLMPFKKFVQLVIEMDISRAKAAPSVVSAREAACLACGDCEAVAYKEQSASHQILRENKLP